MESIRLRGKDFVIQTNCIKQVSKKYIKNQLKFDEPFIAEDENKIYIYNNSTVLHKRMIKPTNKLGKLTIISKINKQYEDKVKYWDREYVDPVKPHTIICIDKQSGFVDRIPTRKEINIYTLLCDVKTQIKEMLFLHNYTFPTYSINILCEILNYSSYTKFEYIHPYMLYDSNFKYKFKVYKNHIDLFDNILIDDTSDIINIRSKNIEIPKGIDSIILGYHNGIFYISDQILDVINNIQKYKMGITNLKCGVALWEDYWWRIEHNVKSIKLRKTTYELNYDMPKIKKEVYQHLKASFKNIGINVKNKYINDMIITLSTLVKLKGEK